MFYKTTVQKIFDRVREECDLEDSEFVTDESMLRLFNEVRRNVRGVIISALSDEGVLLTSTELNFVDKKADIPEDLHTIFELISSQYVFRAISLSDLIRGEPTASGEIGYALQGDKIVLQKDIPSVNLLYYPIELDAEELDEEVKFLRGEEQWVIFQMAADILQREETPNNEMKEKVAGAYESVLKQNSNKFKGSQRVVSRRRR